MVQSIADGLVSEGQVAAFCMATFFNGMSVDERVALTLAMRDSGAVLTWPDLPGPVLDKHSTGGIGDAVSLMLAPLLAACGAYVPMISGRGLGHTGGTLDKLDSIPGYVSQPDETLFRRVTRDVGCAIIGQTADIAPADKRLYAVRDVTATVESLDLITASILSKKLAAGLDGLVLDVKFGSGAFMAETGEARALGQSLVEVACGAGCRATALLTDMDEPLGSAAGNALEVALALNYLTGKQRDPRLHKVILSLGAELMVTGKLASSIEAARDQLSKALTSGAATERFAKMVAGLGAPSDFVEGAERYLAKAPVVRAVRAPQDGYVTAINGRAVGLAVIELGGGRRRADDRIDPSVGFADFAPIGSKLTSGTPLAMVHAPSEDAAIRASAALVAAYAFGEKPPAPRPLVLERITAT